ncbi:MAG: outer membrane beta-barrel protein [Verrucomicrobia bacterium]|nr:outer membrane beta-barrel protein [Verrucomicrobiota bacterium]
MKITAVLTATALILATGMTMAQTTTTTTRTTFAERFAYDREGDFYRANEFSFDVFGSYHRNSQNEDDFFDQPKGGRWGGGIGLNYFFTRNIGIGVDTSIHNNRGAFIDNASLSAIARFPIAESGFAPYILGGGGRIFDPTDAWSLHAGVGFEFRFNPNTGIFIDGRYAWGEDSNDYSLIRSGLRFAF